MATQAWRGIITDIDENGGNPLVTVKFPNNNEMSEAVLPESLFDDADIGEKVLITISVAYL